MGQNFVFSKLQSTPPPSAMTTNCHYRVRLVSNTIKQKTSATITVKTNDKRTKQHKEEKRWKMIVTNSLLR